MTEQRRMPVKTATLDVALEGYEGWSFTIRSNPKQKTIDALFSKETEQLRDALNTLVVAWNYVDEEGQPLPLPRDGGLAECTDELIDATWSALIDWLKEKYSAPKVSEKPSEST